VDIRIHDVLDEATVGPAIRAGLRLQLRRPRRYGVILLAGSLLLGAFDLLRGHRPAMLEVVLALSALVVLVGVPRRAYRTALASLRKVPGYGQPREVHLTDEGLDIRTPVSRAQIVWSAVSAASEHDRVILVRYGQSYIPLTTRDLDPGQVADLRAFLAGRGLVAA
jgi:hypothetical protein